MVIQINSIHLSIERKIVTFATAKQFGVLLVFLTCSLVSFFSDTAFSQTKPEPSATLHSPEDNRVVLTPEEQAWLGAHPNIRLGYIDSAEPEVIVSQDGNHTGMLVDFLAELNRRLGTQIGLDIDTIPGILEQAKTNKVDGILEMLPEYADKLGLLKTETYLTAYPALFGRRSDINIGLADIAGKKVAISDKIYFSEKIAKQYCSEATIVKVSNPLEGLRLINQGDVDFFIGVSFDSYLLVKYHLFDLAVKHVFFDLPSRFGMAIRADWPELVSILNKGITSFTENEIDAFMTKWFHLPQQEQTVKLNLEEQAWIAQKHTIRVRIVNFPPYTILGQGKLTGIVPDYLKRITEQTGVKFKLESTSSSYAEALRGLQNLEGPDVIPSMMFSPEDRNVLLSNPYQASPVVFYTRMDAAFITTISDLFGKRVIVNKGTVIEQTLAREYPAVNLVYCRSAEQGLHMLAEGTADAFVGNLTATSFLIQKHGLTNIRVAAPSPMPLHEMSFGVRKDWPELTGIINKVLDGITEEERSAMQGKYLSVRYEHGIRSGDVVKWGGIAVGLASLIILLFVGWNRILHQKVKERTAEILEKESRFRHLVEQTPMAIEIHDLEGKIVQANPAFASMHNLEGEALNQILEHYNVRKDEQAEELGLQPYIERVYAGEDVIFPPYKYSTDEATKSVGHETAPHELYTQVRGFPLKNSNGQVINAVFFAEDITEQKHARELLMESESRFRATFEQAAVGIAHVSPDGGFLRINQRFCSILGYTQSEMLALTFQVITHPDDLEADLDRVNKLLVGEFETYSLEKKYFHKNGGIIWVNLTVSLLRTSDGKPDYFISVIEDISERKQTENALQDSEEKFRGLVEQSPLSIQVFNLDGQIVQVNKAWQKLWGISDEDLPEVLKEYNVLEDEEAKKLGFVPLIKKAFEGEIVVLPVTEYDASTTMENLEIGHVEANKRWVLGRLYPVRNSKGDIVNVVDIEEDISVRKQAEEEILNYQRRLKSLASQLTIVEEKERSHIAADLHDNIGQTLAYSRIQVARAKKYASEEKLANILDEISQSLLKTIQDTKDLVFELSSPVLNELGLHSAILHWLEENVSGKHGIEFELVGAKVIFPLSIDLRAILFRNIRELLTNVIRHAKASKVIVSLVENEIELKCIVTDNGSGFDIQELKEKEGVIKKYGLFSIKERMEDMGGSMEIISEPGKGCKAILSIPLGSTEEKATVEI